MALDTTPYEERKVAGSTRCFGWTLAGRAVEQALNTTDDARLATRRMP
ncbi:MAG: hypothetical protein ACLQPH_21545 [Acidimicrobiales bacterium]